MSKGLLLDSHSAVWLNAAAPMLALALAQIDEASCSNRLYISHISIWELGAASGKKNPSRRPDLGGRPVHDWFKHIVDRFDLRVLSISARIALEASRVPSIYGSGDPGDCFLIATAHVRNLELVTRDRRIKDFAEANPAYLEVVSC